MSRSNFWYRFNLHPSARNSFKSYKSNAASPCPWMFHLETTHNGDQMERWSSEVACSERYVIYLSGETVDNLNVLLQLINLFLAVANELFGPITMIRKSGFAVKHISWRAAEFGDEDWKRLKEISDILKAHLPAFHFLFTESLPPSFVSGLQPHPTSFLIWSATNPLARDSINQGSFVEMGRQAQWSHLHCLPHCPSRWYWQAKKVLLCLRQQACFRSLSL